MALTYGFYNSVNHDRRYFTTQFSNIVNAMITDGVFLTRGNAFAVTPAANGLGVNVDTGFAWFGSTWTENDQLLPLTLTAADVSRPRIDAIVLDVNGNDDVRTNDIIVVTGAPYSTPTKPALINEGKHTQHALAYITVNANATSILAENIELVVGQNETPYADAKLSGIDITALFQQWQGEFETWFADVQSQLEGDVATNLLNKINALEQNKLDKVTDRATAEDLSTGAQDKWVSAGMLKENIPVGTVIARQKNTAPPLGYISMAKPCSYPTIGQTLFDATRDRTMYNTFAQYTSSSQGEPWSRSKYYIRDYFDLALRKKCLCFGGHTSRIDENGMLYFEFSSSRMGENSLTTKYSVPVYQTTEAYDSLKNVCIAVCEETDEIIMFGFVGNRTLSGSLNYDTVVSYSHISEQGEAEHNVQISRNTGAFLEIQLGSYNWVAKKVDGGYRLVNYSTLSQIQKENTLKVLKTDNIQRQVQTFIKTPFAVTPSNTHMQHIIFITSDHKVIVNKTYPMMLLDANLDSVFLAYTGKTFGDFVANIFSTSSSLYSVQLYKRLSVDMSYGPDGMTLLYMYNIKIYTYTSSTGSGSKYHGTPIVLFGTDFIPYVYNVSVPDLTFSLDLSDTWLLLYNGDSITDGTVIRFPISSNSVPYTQLDCKSFYAGRGVIVPQLCCISDFTIINQSLNANVCKCVPLRDGKYVYHKSDDILYDIIIVKDGEINRIKKGRADNVMFFTGVGPMYRSGSYGYSKVSTGNISNKTAHAFFDVIPVMYTRTPTISSIGESTTGIEQYASFFHSDTLEEHIIYSVKSLSASTVDSYGTNVLKCLSELPLCTTYLYRAYNSSSSNDDSVMYPGFHIERFLMEHAISLKDDDTLDYYIKV